MNYIKPKKTVELVNENIPDVDLLVIDAMGNKLGLLSKRKALAKAQEEDYDLVVVAPEAKPMVAKLMDYSKFRYEQQKKSREIKKNQKVVQLKEVRLSPTIDKHDFDTKLRAAKKFLDAGDKVKVTIRFLGRMITHREVGEEVMNRFVDLLAETANVESKPKMEGKYLISILAPLNN